MSRLQIRGEDGMLYEPRIEHLTKQEVFEYVQQGEMSFEQFEEYLENLEYESKNQE